MFQLFHSSILLLLLLLLQKLLLLSILLLLYSFTLIKVVNYDETVYMQNSIVILKLKVEIYFEL